MRGIMEDLTGSRVGPYEIASFVGAGGMGDVYLARDTKLDRKVALKVLPTFFARNTDRVARFEREARTLAALNHPNIATIYGVEETGGRAALVMEFADGPTLADRLATGRIPADEVVHIASQIAAALEAAHEQGIIHRDLKPSNIKLRPDGTVKVLDFGLAKVAAPDRADAGPAVSTAGRTQLGFAVGTPAYMSPEQARGLAVDKRTDIWAFGCVLFEMLTGRPPFKGEDVSALFAAILSHEPDWQLLPHETALANHIVRRCLEKDPKRRLRDIGEARLALDDAIVPLSSSTHSPVPRRSAVAVALGVMAGAAVVIAALFYWRGYDSIRQHILRYEIQPPDNEAVFTFAISADGQQVAITTHRSGSLGQNRRIWIRRLDALYAQPIEGTEDAYGVFWSPDGRSIAFFAGALSSGELKRVDLAGGPPLKVCDAPGIASGSWGAGGTILFTGLDGILYAVNASGGSPHPMTTLDGSRQEIAHRYPHFLPDGRRFLYTAIGATGERSAIYAGSLDGAPAKRLLTSNTSATYTQAANGQEYVLFMRGQTLLAQRFDAADLSVDGEPFSVAESVATPTDTRYPTVWPQFSSSANGVLTYQGTGNASKELVWVDRSGRRLSTVGEPADYSNLALSPNEELLAISRMDPQARTRDIWIFELARNVARRVTFHGADDTNPVWAPDNRRIAFSSTRSGPRAVYVKDTSSTLEEQLLARFNEQTTTMDWSADGRFVLVGDYLIDVGDGRPRIRLAGVDNPTLSRDGKWMAYHSSETGRSEVFVQSLSAITAGQSSRKWQVSTSGGSDPEWRRDTRELYFLNPDKQLIAVSVEEQRSELQIRSAKVLFRADLEEASRRAHYQPAANGQRFLLVQPVGGVLSPPITVVVNWPADRVP
jgi:Tol biopolymer transport system component/predicted Ser/Thr protein kinase